MLREMRGFLAGSPAPLRVPWTVANTTRWLATKDHADKGGVGLAMIGKEYPG